MIYAYTGKTGSGKTFNMVRHAYAAWKAGNDIYTNTFLNFGQYGGTPGVSIIENPEYFSAVERALNWMSFQWHLFWKTDFLPAQRGRIIYFEDISEILDATDGLILFDEAQVLFNARQWESLPPEFQYKLQQHRKHHLDLICTTQNMGTIDITYRRLVHTWVHHETIFTLGNFFGWYRRKFKDVDMLYNSVDDLKVDDVKIQWFFIGFWSRRLYDTLFDVGYKRIKKIWLYSKTTGKNKLYLIPKELSFKSALSAMSTLQSALGLKKSIYSKES